MAENVGRYEEIDDGDNDAAKNAAAGVLQRSFLRRRSTGAMPGGFLPRCWSCILGMIGCKDADWLQALEQKTGISRKSDHEHLFVRESEWTTTKKLVFFPVGRAKTLFDILVMVCVLYSCAEVPYRAAFEVEVATMYQRFDYVVQAIFIIDVLVNFNTAYMVAEYWIIDRPTIARSYMRGWFWIDLPASLPLVEIYTLLTPAEVLAGNPADQDLKLLRAFRLFRLLRLLKVLKMGEAVRTIENATGVDLKALVVLNVILIIIAYSHLVACIFYAVSVASASVYADTWAGSFGFDDGSFIESSSGESLPPPFERYVISLIWVVSLVTGLPSEVGPVNHIERMVALVIYILSALLLALLIAVVTQQSLAYANDPINVASAEVANFCRFHKMPRGLRDRVSSFFDVTSRNNKFSGNDSTLVERMTPPLQEQVWNHLLKSSVGKIGLFTKITEGADTKLGRMFADPRMFHVGVYKALQYATYMSGERILSKGGSNEQIFFLSGGEMSARAGKTAIYSLVDVGSFCGERCLLQLELTEDVDTYARTRCDILYLLKDDLFKLVAELLVPVHRKKLASDVLNEIVRKTALHHSHVQSMANSHEATDELKAELEMLTTRLAELSEATAQEALPDVAG